MRKNTRRMNMNMMIMRVKKVHRVHYLMRNICKTNIKKIIRVIILKINSMNILKIEENQKNFNNQRFSELLETKMSSRFCKKHNCITH